jgi:hypothetical protein
MGRGNRKLQHALHNLLEHEQWPWNLHIWVAAAAAEAAGNSLSPLNHI